LILLAAGKAAGSMIEAAETHCLDAGFPPSRMSGIAVARHGYGRPTRVIPMVEAGHPVPDAAGPRIGRVGARSSRGAPRTISCWC
jgi:hydroxypyruvate reductase